MKVDRQPEHPGVQLMMELAQLEISAGVLANLLRVPKNRITEMLRGKRAMTPDTALRLERFLGTSALYWMNLQSRYDLQMAVRASRSEIMKLPSIKGVRDSLPKD